MTITSTTRCLASRISAAIAVGVFALFSVIHHAHGQAPIQRIPPPQPPRMGNGQVIGPRGNAAGVPPRGAHLDQWMQQHNTMDLQQQQRALQNEPGFHQLPQGTQQRMLNRLDRLNTLPPQQRERVIQRNEFMERMTPQQRGDVRSAMGQMGALQEDRRRAVARSFRELRTLPPDQRNAILNSPQYRQQFNDEERGTLGNLLSVSPLLPPSR